MVRSSPPLSFNLILILFRRPITPVAYARHSVVLIYPSRKWHYKQRIEIFDLVKLNLSNRRGSIAQSGEHYTNLYNPSFVTVRIILCFKDTKHGSHALDVFIVIRPRTQSFLTDIPDGFISTQISQQSQCYHTLYSHSHISHTILLTQTHGLGLCNHGSSLRWRWWRRACWVSSTCNRIGPDRI